ncbi:Putative periplasmic ATP /GTP-binding protein [hydrothermal vent metagenome]|uniref:Putative periplasmic ATP /GTP-binding protein n=1 Tax=hydrothermal vent metagenome TaxID=652676 RepID=A0A1W1D249_9ZZZZ
MKKAFTLMELIFVLIVIGILAVLIIPKTKTNPLQEAAIQLASHLRYTQHLAMIDDKYTTSDDKWYKMRWILVFSSSKYTGGSDVWAYTIFSDTAGNHTGDAQQSEIAKNPLNQEQLMTGGYGKEKAINFTDDGFKGMKELNIGTKYGIIGDNGVKLKGGCRYSRIGFDYLGRPMYGSHKDSVKPYDDYHQQLIKTDCKIILTDQENNSVTLIIKPETGYISINF